MGSIAKSHIRKGRQTYAKIRVYKDQSSKQNKCITLVLTQSKCRILGHEVFNLGVS
jgi:hypothetical protein